MTRNPSQKVTTGTDDALDNLENISIITDIIEAFKEISEPNTLRNPKKETGGLLLGRKLEDKYIIDILLIPKQNGYTGYFETINEYEIHNSYVVPSYGGFVSSQVNRLVSFQRPYQFCHFSVKTRLIQLEL